MGNKALNKAKESKNDEFYTRIEDVEAECRHYEPLFEGQIIYCPCDDPEWSAFWKYFADNFARLKIKRLIATHYNPSGHSFKDEMTVEGLRTTTPLKDDGDFRSKECESIMKSCDIVVTNPPFSLFRVFMNEIIKNDKRFLIIGNNQAVAYKEILPLMIKGKIWIGYERGNTTFGFPKTYQPKEVMIWYDKNGNPWKCVSICWYTDLGSMRKGRPLRLIREFKGHEDEFQMLDGTKTININSLKDIPKDWDGSLAVPITLLQEWNPDQFEIKGLAEAPTINEKKLFKRLIVRRTSRIFAPAKEKELNEKGFEQLRLI